MKFLPQVPERNCGPCTMLPWVNTIHEKFPWATSSKNLSSGDTQVQPSKSHFWVGKLHCRRVQTSPQPALLQGYILKVLGTGRQVHWGWRNTFWCQESTTSTISFLMVAYLHMVGVCHTRIIHHRNQLATVNHAPLYKENCFLKNSVGYLHKKKAALLSPNV